MLVTLIDASLILSLCVVLYFNIKNMQHQKKLIKDNYDLTNDYTNKVKLVNRDLSDTKKELEELSEQNITLETETVEQNATIKNLQTEADRLNLEISDLEDEVKHCKASELNYEAMSIYIDQLEQTIKILENKPLEYKEMEK